MHCRGSLRRIAAILVASFATASAASAALVHAHTGPASLEAGPCAVCASAPVAAALLDAPSLASAVSASYWMPDPPRAAATVAIHRDESPRAPPRSPLAH